MLSRRGQAMIEILPMIIVFLTAISASVSYFQFMRNAILVQEAARNATFAKIANSGPLVSPPQSEGTLMTGPYGNGGYRMIAGGASNGQWSSADTCLTVFPGQSMVPENLPKIMDDVYQLSEATRAVIYRNPGNSCR